MLTHPTLEQMQALGFKGMADAYRDMAEQGQTSELDREDWLALMLDRKAATRADSCHRRCNSPHYRRNKILHSVAVSLVARGLSR